MAESTPHARAKTARRSAMSRRVAVVLGLVAVAMPIAGGAWAIGQARASVALRVREGQMATATAVAESTGSDIDLAIALAQQHARAPGLIRFVGEGRTRDVTDAFQNVVATTPIYRSIALYSVDGLPEIATPVPLSAVGRRYTDSPAPLVSAPLPVEEDAIVVVREPVIAPGGRVLGTLIAEVSFAKTVGGLENLRFGDTGSVTVVNAQGQVLITGEASRRGRTITTPEARRLIASSEPASDEYFARSVGRRELTAFVPIPARDWGVLVTQASAEAFAPVRRLTGGIAVAVAALIAAGLALTAFATRNVARHERLLRQEEERFRLIFETAAEGAIEMDARGAITAWNSEAARIFGWRDGEVEGKRFADVALAPAAARVFEEALDEFVQGGESALVGKRTELRGVHRDSGPFSLEIAMQAFAWRDTRRFHAFVHDISARKSAELATRDALRYEQEASKRLRELDQLKNEFVGMVAHDLRSPLAVIAGFADLMLRNYSALSDVEKKQFLETISGGAQSMATLIDDVLNVAKIESGELGLRSAPFDLGKLVRRTVEELQVADPERSAVLDIPDALPPAYGDDQRQWQVITNLLTNAWKFSPSQVPVEVSVAVDGGFLRVSVRDHGPGIPKDQHDRLFKKFSRAVTEGTKKVKGTGLGLYICKALVEAQGGAISVDSDAGEGATFAYTVPIAVDERGPDDEDGSAAW